MGKIISYLFGDMLRDRSNAKAAEGGFGPFESKTVKSMLCGECQSCGKRIPDCSIPNSIVFKPSKIVFICKECREDGVYAEFLYAFNGVNICIADRKKIVDFLYRRETKGRKFSHYEALITVRHLPSALMWKNAPDLDDAEVEKYIDDNLTQENCGDCYARLKDTPHCQGCELPLISQWSYRLSRSDERKLLRDDV